MKEKHPTKPTLTKRPAKKKIEGFQVLEEECIWMKAGVINFRLCDQAYDCNNCPFDTGMRKVMGMEDGDDSKKIAPRWVEFLQARYQGASRPCRHVLTGRIDAPKICTINYECHHCSFDQMLDEVDLNREPDAPGYQLVSGYRMANGYYYHMGHNWARIEHGGRIRMGIDEFAVKLFGAPDRLELPPLGEKLVQHEVGWAFERRAHRAAVLSPASGTVLAVNRRVAEHPEITRMDPYKAGWLMILEPKTPKLNLKGLYFGAEGVQWMEQEVRRLLHTLGSDYHHLAATGGRPVDDIFGTVGGLNWNDLVRDFLRTERVDA
jgi:glycine cleavage system H lipoate-binding protein